MKVLRRKKICVLFLVVHGSVWQYEDVYAKFKADPRFDTKIIIVPYTLYGKQVMIENLRKTEQVLLNYGHEVFVSYREDIDGYIDIKDLFKPDIVFFTNPHKLTEPQFYINNFVDDCLTCYAPYGFLTANIQQLQFNQEFHNLLWRYFLPTNVHKRMAKKYADNKGRNAVVVGYPKCDVFIDKKTIFGNPWKNSKKNLKRLIWAPHHTLENDNLELGLSTFERYSKFMLELAHKYEEKVQFALKPHPLLWIKLEQSKSWTRAQIDEYRNSWIEGCNTQLEEGGYLDLFYHSDGMILDSISFISEYLYLNKPHLYLEKDEHTKHKFNEYGILAYKYVYKASNSSDIENFIERIVINNTDVISRERHQFVIDYLMPPGEKSASDAIYRHISQVII